MSAPTAPAAGLAPMPAAPSHSRDVRTVSLARQLSLAGVLAGFVVIFTVTGHGFFSQQTWNSTTQYASEFLILGVAETLVILSGGIDLSVGSVIALSGVCGAWTMAHTASLGTGACIVIGVAAALGVGLAVGALNGFLITIGRITPFIATLGTLGIAAGLANVVSGGSPITAVPNQIGTVANQTVLGWFPTLFIVSLVVFAFGGWLLRGTRFGIHVRAVGSSLKAAREAGVAHRSVLLRVYMLSGVLAAVAGVLLLGQFVIGSPLTGANDELNAIAAVVIGGASLAGGRGTLLGTFFGALIISILVTGLIASGVPAFWQVVAVGVVIVTAVFIDQIKDRAGREI
jgi:ribose/xylose/arabinose/galactoside ABC-type transport system permease subunit